MPESKIEIHYGAAGDTLKRYMNERARVTGIMGPLGSGKTIASCQRILKQMCEQEPNAKGVRPTRWCALRNTYPELMDTTVKDLCEVFEGLGHLKKGGLERPRFVVSFALEDGTTVESEVIFLALDRPDSIRQLRGIQATGFWLNEMKELDKAVVDMADLRHGRYPSIAAGGVNPTWHGMIGDTNAPDEDHWYYDLAENQRPDGWVFYRQPGGLLRSGSSWVVNPDAENLEHLPEGYYIRGMQGKAEDWIRVNLANEYGFVRDGKPVHPEYVDSIHCAHEILEPVAGIPIMIGLDFGLTPAAALFQRLPIGRYVFFDELTSVDMAADKFAPELKRHLSAHYPTFDFEMPWGDPAGGQGNQSTHETPFQILRKHGIRARPCETNDPLVRRAALSGPAMRNCMDGKPALLISPKCKMLRKGLAGGFCYKRIQVSGERYHDKPDKNQYSHIVEAAEYGLLGAGEGREATIGKARMAAPVVINKGFNPLQRRRA